MIIIGQHKQKEMKFILLVCIILVDKFRGEEQAAMSKEACERFGKKPDAETGLIDKREKLSYQDRDDSIYYELNDNGQMVESRPKESGNDSIYYTLDDRGELVRSEPNPNVEGKASFSKDSDIVTLNTAGVSGMFDKIYICLDV